MPLIEGVSKGVNPPGLTVNLPVGSPYSDLTPGHTIYPTGINCVTYCYWIKRYSLKMSKFLILHLIDIKISKISQHAGLPLHPQKCRDHGDINMEDPLGSSEWPHRKWLGSHVCQSQCWREVTNTGKTMSSVTPFILCCIPYNWSYLQHDLQSALYNMIFNLHSITWSSIFTLQHDLQSPFYNMIFNLHSTTWSSIFTLQHDLQFPFYNMVLTINLHSITWIFNYQSTT